MYTGLDAKLLFDDAGCREYGFSALNETSAQNLVATRVRTLELPGEVAEVGVLNGGSLGILARMSAVPIHAFDTFIGFPEVHPEFGDLVRTGHYPWGRGYEAAKARFAELPHVTLYPGTFPGTADELGARTFCFVHCDVDTYGSTRDVYEFFWPLLVSGGIILCDDYSCAMTPGAKRAVDEWSARHAGEFTITLNPCGSLAVQKAIQG